MRVPARVFADDVLFRAIRADQSLEQLQNVATLPGIVDAALAMPDIHQGYGFPVGGVAATELPDGVVSPGGVGYDINCGVRLLALPLDADELGDGSSRSSTRSHARSRPAPASAARCTSTERTSTGCSSRGRPLLVRERGIGNEDDLERTESDGCLPGADPGAVSERAHVRGWGSSGRSAQGTTSSRSSGSTASSTGRRPRAFGLDEGQVTVLIHSGSRGLGHQVCTDYVHAMEPRFTGTGSRCPIVSSPARRSPPPRGGLPRCDGRRRELRVGQPARDDARGARVGRARAGGAAAAGTRQVYDVAHNVAKVERTADGTSACTERARRGPSPRARPRSGRRYRDVGQPVFVPGSMGTASYVLAGEPGSLERSFGTTCHGAGRRMRRTGARRAIGGAELRRRLEADGIVVRCPSNKGLAEEAPFAYKDVERVVDVVEAAGLARRVARLRPLGVVKG